MVYKLTLFFLLLLNLSHENEISTFSRDPTDKSSVKCSVCNPQSFEVSVLFLGVEAKAFQKGCLREETYLSHQGSFHLAVKKVNDLRLFGAKIMRAEEKPTKCDEKSINSDFLPFLRRSCTLLAVFGRICNDSFKIIDSAAEFIPEFFSFAWSPCESASSRFPMNKISVFPAKDKLVSAIFELSHSLSWETLVVVKFIDDQCHHLNFKTSYEGSKKPIIKTVSFYGQAKAQFCSELRQLKTNYAIFVLLLPVARLRECLLMAYKLNMTNRRYTFVVPTPFLEHVNFTKHLKSGDIWRRNDKSDEEAAEVFGNVLFITWSFAELFENRSDHLKMEKDIKSFYKDDRLYSQYSPFVYDSVQVFARGYNKSAGDFSKLAREVRTMNFTGQTGQVAFDKNGNRLATVLVWKTDPLHTGFRVAISYVERLHKNKTVWENKTRHDIFWRNTSCLDERPNTSVEFVLYKMLTPTKDESDPKSRLIIQLYSLALQMFLILFFVELSFTIFFLIHLRMRNRIVWNIKPESLVLLCDPKHSDESPEDTTQLTRTPVQSWDDSSSSAVTTKNVSYYLEGAGLVQLNHICTKQDPRKLQAFEDKVMAMRELRHVNVVRFVGVSWVGGALHGVWEHCANGPLSLTMATWKQRKFHVEPIVQMALAMDLCNGLAYLHRSQVRAHGCLTLDSCYIGEHWDLKLSCFGLERYADPPLDPQCVADWQVELEARMHSLFLAQDSDTHDCYSVDFSTCRPDCACNFQAILHKSPEQLRRLVRGEVAYPTQSADIYAAGMILKELLTVEETFDRELANMTVKEVVGRLIGYNWTGEPFRPAVKALPISLELLMPYARSCWKEVPSQRPSARELYRNVRKHCSSNKTSNNITTSLMRSLNNYSTRLESIVADRTRELADEKRRTELLLYQMLPPLVADELRAGNPAPAQAFDEVTVFFSDIVNFTDIASTSRPIQIVEMLNRLYTIFDLIIRDYQVYKVETIGDAYMVVSGLPVPHADHADCIVDMALAFLEQLDGVCVPHDPSTLLRIRAGVNSGPVVAGVVGRTMPRYCLFGDTVNVASRMESSGKPMKIQISESTYKLIRHNPNYRFSPRGAIDIKGKGQMMTYFVEASEYRTSMRSKISSEMFDCRVSLISSNNSYVYDCIYDEKAARRESPRKTSNVSWKNPMDKIPDERM